MARLNPQPHPQLADIPRESALCFTGHRPDKLPTGDVLKGLRQTIYFYIRYAVAQGYTHFFTGLADGIDFETAYYLFHLRKIHPELCVIGVQPCDRDYEDFFRRCGYSVPHLRLMQQNVDRLIVLPGSAYDRTVYYKRNRLMVNHSSAVIAVCNNVRSGSMQTLRYAQENHLAQIRIFPDPPRGTIPAPQDWPAELSGF